MSKEAHISRTICYRDPRAAINPVSTLAYDKRVVDSVKARTTAAIQQGLRTLTANDLGKMVQGQHINFRDHKY